MSNSNTVAAQPQTEQYKQNSGLLQDEQQTGNQTENTNIPQVKTLQWNEDSYAVNDFFVLGYN